MKTSKLLVVVVLLQLVIVAGQWLGAPTVIGTVSAQQMDPARDRAQTLDELRQISGKLDKMIDLLGSGKLQVVTVAPDDTKGRTSGR